ncbi:MAG TPA: hypothetical protein PLP90_00025 [Methanoculleus sp.]|nr:hypothetical protein [Methanoculleus sp.]
MSGPRDPPAPHRDELKETRRLLTPNMCLVGTVVVVEVVVVEVEVVVVEVEVAVVDTVPKAAEVET